MNTNTRSTLGTRDVFVAGVALVVASSTLVSEFNGVFTLGFGFAVALGIGFLVNLLLAVSAADLSVAMPGSGSLYDSARGVIGGRAGRTVGGVLGLTFLGMSAFAFSGETASGGFALRELVGLDLPVQAWILLIGAAALLPNLWGLRATAWASAVILVVMLGLRWAFGIAGFLGIGRCGPWEIANLTLPGEPLGGVHWFGEAGVLSLGLALAVWSFVGIEFACSLSGEVKRPGRAMPIGLIAGLVVILCTALVMSFGVAGALPMSDWQTLIRSDAGVGGEAPQLAVGYAMFGAVGAKLMALASVAATLGSLTVILSAMPRLLARLAQDGMLPGAFGRSLATRHPRTNVPLRATAVCVAVYLAPAMTSGAVVEWVYSAAYVWLGLYGCFHLLALLRNRTTRPGLRRRVVVVSAALGLVSTIATIALAFHGGHLAYGGRALLVLLAATAIVLVGRLGSVRGAAAPTACCTWEGEAAS